jgi:hypothetical protein
VPANRFLNPRLGHSQKVSALSDFAYRVWTQYILSADDFGVMRMSPAPLQEGNDVIAQKPARTVERVLELLVSVGLLRRFVHQDRAYVYQHDWYDFQRMTWPSKTIHPAPPPADLAHCSAATQYLFAHHPGGKRIPKFSDSSPEELQKFSDSPSEELLPPRDARRAPLLTANGTRQVANGSEGGPGETAAPFDYERALTNLQDAYPQNRVTSGYRTETEWVKALGDDPKASYAVMVSHLENHKRSHEWRVKGMVPALDKWLREGLWKRTMDEDPPVGDQLSPKTSRTLAAAASILGGKS